MSEPVLCRNPECRRPLDPERVRRHHATTCNDACRAKAWKAEHNYGRHDPPRRRRSPAKRAPEPRISYHKALTAIGEELNGDMPELGARIRRALETCLTPKAREAVGSRTD